jgi:methylmalonyl-CoA mutase
MLQPEIKLRDDFPPTSYEEWRALVEKDLKGAPFERKLISHTYEGIDIEPLYTADHGPDRDQPAGLPGFWPYTRGGHPLGGSECGWDIRQEYLAPDPRRLNGAILDDLAQGVTSAVVRLDMAGRLGLDPAGADAAGLVARDGTTITTLDDLAAAMQEVRLEAIGVGLESGAAFMPAAALMLALWKQRDQLNDEARGSLGADPLAALARDGKLNMSAARAMQLTADLAAWTDRNLDHVRAVRVSTTPYHHAGATAAQDLAFSMATGVAYLRALADAGLDVSAAARQIDFQYSVGTQLFLAIAKLRAARQLWARVVEASGGDDDAARMQMHVQPSQRVMTERDPWVNMLRNTVCCFAGAIAGAESITSMPFDAPLGRPTAQSRRIARNTQIVLHEESQLHRVVDPAGGAWFIESLTTELCDKAWAIFQEIEREGGMLRVLESGWVAGQIDAAFAPRLKNIARRKDPITGVSEFPNLGESEVKTEPVDESAIARAAAERLAARDARSFEPALATLAAAMPGDGTLTDAAIEAALAGASIHEMFAAVKDGEEPATIAPLTPHPYAEPFEALRDASDDHLARCGQRPRVFLANMGPIAHHTARATYSKNFFEAGGFEVVTNNGFTSADDAATAFEASGANIAVICSSDKLYPEFIPDTAPKLRQRGARTIVLAGHPGEHEAAWKDAGVDRFIFMKCDVLATLRELLTEEGVLS